MALFGFEKIEICRKNPETMAEVHERPAALKQPDLSLSGLLFINKDGQLLGRSRRAVRVIHRPH